MTKKGFLICPVKGHTQDETRGVVDALEEKGWNIHWPPRDTDQVDNTGLRICTDNMNAIRCANAVFVLWDGESKGCLFDMGMAFALNKKIFVLSVPECLGAKSFQDMLYAWEESQYE